MKYIRPSKLQVGDTIGVIAPSSPITIPKAQYKKFVDFIKTKGYRIKEGKNLFLEHDYMAGSIDDRLRDFHTMFKDTEVKCIICFWGGFVANQLIDKIDYDLVRSSPKIFVGFSDITTIQSAITTKTGLITYSGPAGITYSKPSFYSYSWEYFSKICIDPENEVLLQPSSYFSDDQYWLNSTNKRIKKKNKGFLVFSKGNASGRIVVGNLQSLLDIHATEYEPNYKGSILFIEEDEDESVAKIERMFFKCRLLGIWDKIDALVIGRFSASNGFKSFKKIDQMLMRALSGYKFPVMYNVDFGHTDPMVTLPFGGQCSIDTKSKKIIIKKSVK